MTDHRDLPLRDDPQRLTDVAEIVRIKATYCRCIDTKDWAGCANLITEDFHLVSDGGVHDGRDEVMAFVSSALETAKTVHHVHSPQLTTTGPDSAMVIWAMNDYIEFSINGSPYVLRGWGHYHEEYVRTGAGWRIKSSQLTRLRVDTEGSLPGQAAAHTDSPS